MKTATRDRILNCTAKLATTPDNRKLTIRNVAEDAGVTTQAVYTLFGGKEGLIAALFEECWNTLTHRLRDVPESSHPLETLCSLGRCYIQFAKENPEFYTLMIGRATGSVTVPDRELRHAAPWSSITINVVNKAIADGILSGSPDEIGRLLWSTAHGYIDLTIHGYLRSDDERFLQQATLALFSTFAGPRYSSEMLISEEWFGS
ncbi:hypothetical protein A3709_01190 [Halioglobus sp. HI00S01]|uniref:TetR/AcrR family transcriptional regulator n=1 Tax=Halioglobus sp. HI00S01 TaxID=1822214 RepID=UPI0007C2CDE8|nr:TetR/AcrR family transcriptional regulator [Halioglobus sp. HI00S01]KZX58114.1 hypothetical protein A3709_01190 [Halioglobus sp. HI00S01]